MGRRHRALANLEMMIELDNTFRNKSVFITGHSGFKGSWLTLWLSRLGANITGFSLPDSQNTRLFQSIQKKSICTSIEGDIGNYTEVANAIKLCEPHFIFHMAAQPLVRQSYFDPLETFQTNTLGTVNLMEAVRKINKPCIVIVITTDKVYYNVDQIKSFQESDPLGGYDPYSASKACAELVVSAYRSSFFSSQNTSKSSICVATARAGNVIGGGDWSSDRIIPDIIRAYLDKSKLFIRKPEAIRPWQYVLDPLYGYLLLAHNIRLHPERFCEAYNFGPLDDAEMSVRDVVQTAIANFQPIEYELASIDKSQLHEAAYLRLNPSKAVKNLNWRPLYNAEEAIRRTMNWYKQYYNSHDPVDLTIQEIASYGT